MKNGESLSGFYTNPNLNINEIAEMVGIPNPSYFSSQFKKYYKISPKDVRK